MSTLYYTGKSGTLYNGDNKEVIKDFSRNFVDLLLTDPPYNIADSGKLTKVGNNISSNKDAWGDSFKDKWKSIEEYSEWLTSEMTAFSPLLKPSASVILFLDRKYTGYFVYLIEKNIGWKFRNKIYFEKINPLPHFRKNNYRSTIEEAVWFTVDKGSNYLFNFGEQKEMKQLFRGTIGSGKKTGHPTEKYRWMIDPLMLRHSAEGDTIIDPFAGSGTVLESAEIYGRKWIGIEKSDVFCSMIKKRMERIPSALPYYER